MVVRRLQRARSSTGGCQRVAGTEGRVRRTRTAPLSVTAKPRFIVDIANLSWGKALQLYLMASYLYYELNRSLITDHEYDALCRRLLSGWRTGNHPHKHVVSRGDLVAGTGYSLSGRYPAVVVGAAWVMLERHAEL